MITPSNCLQISYSSGGTFDSCARKFEFRKIYPRRKQSQDSLPAAVGQALHAGYQTYLATQSEDKAYWALLETYPYELEYTAYDDKRSLEAAVSTLDKMLAYGNMDEWELLQIQRPWSSKEILTAAAQGISDLGESPIVPAVEVPFELILKGINLPDGRGISVIGYMDAGMRNLVTDRKRTLDIKTHRSTLRNADPKYRFDNQQTPYGVVIQHVTQEPCDEFEVLYLDCFVDLQEPRVQLYEYHRDSTDVQEWLANTVLRAQRIQRAVQMDYFPRTDNGCLSFNQACPYLEICQTRDKEAILEYMLMGEEPAAPEVFEPWIQAEIDVFGVEE